LQDWSSDAEFVYWGYDRKQDEGLLVCCGGTKLSVGATEILTCLAQTSYCEVLWKNGTGTVLSPAQERVTINESGLRALSAEPVLSLTARQQVND